MNTAPWVLHVLLAIAVTMVVQMKRAAALFPQRAARHGSR